MPKLRIYTEFDRSFALTHLVRAKGDIEKAAKLSNVEPNALRYWESGGNEIATPLAWGEDPDEDDSDVLERPYPEEAVALPHRTPSLEAPIRGMDGWVKNVFIDRSGPLYNEDHWHLADATIGYFWTNVQNGKPEKMTVGQAELVGKLGGKWQTASYQFYLRQCFGIVPKFVIRIDSVWAVEADDRGFCALVDHELYHCAVALDEFKVPRRNAEDEFIYCMRRHDSEEFDRIVARYGSELTTGGSAGIIRAAQRRASITDEMIAEACGTGRHNPFI
ncbi:MAG: hypothetical protein H8F28_01335 [Fibrella sp.]|nr:hypothetical protein [Armatimonadota bacterium]